MYYIDNYTEEAINKLIPYLIEFPEIVTLTENSANRYQAIEDVLWKIATNFKLVDSRGVFLDAHAHNEVVDLVYTDKARDAFTYGATWSEAEWEQENYNPRVFGTGKFYSQASYLSGVPKDVSEEKLIRAVQEKIIQNNTTGVIEDFIEAMKLHFNATQVEVFESYPLSISLVLSGENLELSSSGDKDAIKKCLPACVSLKDFYINDHKYDRFIYSDKSRYGYDSRYPILIGDTDYMYQYVSNAINLNSTNEEYLIIKNSFANINSNNVPFECITGKITQLNNYSSLYSFQFNDDTENSTYKISLIIKEVSGDYYFFLILKRDLDNLGNWVDVNSLNTEIKAEINKDYTFLISKSQQLSYLKLWIFNGIKLVGQNSNQDASWAYNIIQNDNSFVQINLTDFGIICNTSSIINADYITDNTFDYYSDFTYYAIVGGEIDTNSNIILDDKAHYYVTCFGEKNILFNCLQNKNHVLINTNDTLETDLLVKQGSFNYKKWHSNGRYLNVYNPDGINAGIKWGESGWSTPIQVSFNGYWQAITYGNGRFVAVGSSGYITTSTDGITWTTPTRVGARFWTNITYGNNKFVIFDGYGYTSRSTDGITWTPPSQVNTIQGRGLVYGDSNYAIFVLVGMNGYMATSTNGITWNTPIQVGTNDWYDITYGNGTFIAVGSNGYIATRTNGTWNTPIQVGTNNWINITYGNDTFVAVGSSGYITTSTDGITWTTPIQVGTNDWQDIIYGNNIFVAVSNSDIVTYTQPSDALINSFKLSMDICRPINTDGNIINGLIGQINKLSINSNGTINLPVYTSGNVETLYTITIPTTAQNLIQNKFGNLKIKYDDNIVYIYLNNELVKSENIPNISVRYLNTKLELGPTNAFIKNFKFSCNYTEGLEAKNREYSIPLIKDIYEENKLIQPNNTNARFLTVPQLIDNKENKDLYGNPVIREVN